VYGVGHETDKVKIARYAWRTNYRRKGAKNVLHSITISMLIRPIVSKEK